MLASLFRRPQAAGRNGADAPADGPGRSVLTVAGAMARREYLGMLALTGAAVLALGALALLFLVVRADRTTPLVFVVDGAGVVHSGAASKLGLQSEIFRRLVVQAARVALSRTCSDNGAVFDEYEELALLFNQDGRQAIQADLAAQAQDFLVRKISQKVHVDKTRALAERGGRRLIAAIGRLERSGQFEGRPFRELVPFVAVFSFVPNPRLDQTGAFPFVVADVKVSLSAESALDEGQ